MLSKLSVLLVLCEIVAFTYGGVLPYGKSEEKCSDMYMECARNEECCFPYRCLDFGNGKQCQPGTDNPSVIDNGQLIQPPSDLLGKLGCSVFGDKCEKKEDCCAPFTCVAEGICKEPKVDPYGLGGYGGYGGYGGFP